MRYEISVEWFDRRKRTKDYKVQFATGKEAQAWLDENGNALYFKAMVWIYDAERGFGMEYGDCHSLY